MFSSLLLIVLGCGVAIPLALLAWAPISISFTSDFVSGDALLISFKGWELVYQSIMTMITGVNEGEAIVVENLSTYPSVTQLFYLLNTFLANTSLSGLSGSIGFDIVPIMTNLIIGALVLFIVLVAIFSLSAVLIGLTGLLAGKVLNFKTFRRTGWWIFSLLIFEAGIPIAMYFVLPQLMNGFEIIDAETEMIVMTIDTIAVDALWQMVYLIGAFVIAVVINIIYTARFKNALYIKNLKALEAAQAARTASGYPGFGMQKVNDYPPNATLTQSGRPEIIYVPTPQPTHAEKPVDYNKLKGLPDNLNAIGGHSFSKNLNLEVAIIPKTISEIGASAFANCLNLQLVSLPGTIKKIGYNAFFGCKKLTRINFDGKKADWRKIERGSNWLASSGTTTVICLDGPITVNPYH